MTRPLKRVRKPSTRVVRSGITSMSTQTFSLIYFSLQLRSDYTLIAKTLGRIGSAHQRKGETDSAIKYFQKSLAEHRTPEILNKLREAERVKAEADKEAYIDHEKSHAAREEGNVKFKAGDFVGAVKDYTESIKRDPADPRGYNNRAAAYIKLAALPEALKDVNEAIKVDPEFGR